MSKEERVFQNVLKQVPYLYDNELVEQLDDIADSLTDDDFFNLLMYCRKLFNKLVIMPLENMNLVDIKSESLCRRFLTSLENELTLNRSHQLQERYAAYLRG